MLLPSIESTESLTTEQLQRLVERSLGIYTDALIALTGRNLEGVKVSEAGRLQARERSVDNWNMGTLYTTAELARETGRKL